MICVCIRGLACSRERCRQIFSRTHSQLRNTGQYSTKVEKMLCNDSQIKKVLHVLNTCSATDLNKFQIGRSKCEKIVHFRNANGAFLSLTDVLKVNGMGLKSLSEICDCILEPESRENESTKTIRNNQRQLITPNLHESNRQNVETVVGLHVANHVVSWAKLTRDNCLVNWDLVNHSEQLRKPHPVSVFEMVLNSTRALPIADLYIMEDLLRPGQQASNKTATLLANVQLWQFRAMLHMWLNLRNKSWIGRDAESMHKVYFLRPHIAARLFNTLVGTETVSLEKTVEDIIRQKSCDHPVPYSPVSVDEILRNYYFSKINLDKESMGRALLISLAFLNLVVQKRPESLSMLS